MEYQWNNGEVGQWNTNGIMEYQWSNGWKSGIMELDNKWNSGIMEQ